MSGLVESRCWGWFIIVCDVVVLAFVIAGSMALGLEVLTKPYFLSAIGATLGVNGVYLVTVGRRKGSEKLRYIGAALMVTSSAILILLIAIMLKTV